MIPLIEKYRPKLLSQIIGNEEVIQVLTSILNNGIIPNMLFYGPPGTGKTTAIKAISYSFPKYCVLELNASDERGISTVRETIKEFASTFSKNMKLIILDEADMMTKDAQNALRRIMEDFNKTVRFCLIVNHLKKIISPILSRCTKFRFGPINNVINKAKEICINENIEYTEEGIKTIAEISNGDMRRIINDIQGISISFNVINKNNVLQFNGITSQEVYEQIFENLKIMSMSDSKRELIKHQINCESLIDGICELVKKSDMKNKMKILKGLCDIEYRKSIGCSETIQLNAIIGLFILNKD